MLLFDYISITVKIFQFILSGLSAWKEVKKHCCGKYRQCYEPVKRSVSYPQGLDAKQYWMFLCFSFSPCIVYYLGKWLKTLIEF